MGAEGPQGPPCPHPTPRICMSVLLRVRSQPRSGTRLRITMLVPVKLKAQVCRGWAACPWKHPDWPALRQPSGCACFSSHFPIWVGTPPWQSPLWGCEVPSDSALLPPPTCPQGDLQEKSLEHLRLSDRSSLLSEIQALRAQLRLTHLQNQEKLQQLCTALTSAEARGSQQEHQLRRQGGCCPFCPSPEKHAHLMFPYG